jgi:hypothetical protein
MIALGVLFVLFLLGVFLPQAIRIWRKQVLVPVKFWWADVKLSLKEDIK